MAVSLIVPAASWPAFRDAVLKVWFQDEEPSLIHHTGEIKPGFESATFESREQADIDTVISMLPEHSSYSIL